MVRQTAEWLSADYVLCACFCKSRHFSSDEPALAHFYALTNILISTLSKVFKIMRRLENALLVDDLYLLLLELVKHIITNAIHKSAAGFLVVKLLVIDSVRRTVKHEVQQSRHVRLTALRQQEVVQVIVRKR